MTPSKLYTSSARFSRDEDGAVTVDWVVLSAAVLGMCIAIYTTLGNGAHDHAELIGSTMDNYSIPTY